MFLLWLINNTKRLIEPAHERLVLIASASCQSLDEPACLSSLAMVFAAHFLKSMDMMDIDEDSGQNVDI